MVVAEIVTVPVSSPTVEGVPLTVLKQVAPGARVFPEMQVPAVNCQSAAKDPPKVVIVLGKVSVVVPVLVTVKFWVALAVCCGTLPKSKGVGAMLIEVVDTGKPVPVKGAVPLALPAMFNVAVLDPVAAGEKVMVSVQVPETATVPPSAQVPPVRAYSEAFVPVMVKNGVLSVSVADPEFVTVTVKGELVVPF